MSTVTTRHHPRTAIERSRHGFRVSLPKGKRSVSVDLTRKQALALEERLNDALHHSEPHPLREDEDRWLDPQIM
jgi:hypothetical protein